MNFREGQFIKMKDSCSGNRKGDIIELDYHHGALWAKNCSCKNLWELVDPLDIFDNADDYNEYCLKENKKEKKYLKDIPTIEDLRLFLGMGGEDDDVIGILGDEDEEDLEDETFIFE